MAERIQVRRDTAANWESENPVLAQGEPGFDLTNRVIKVGDGTTPWINLSGIQTPGLAQHVADTDNPHEVTAAQVGADPAGTALSAVTSHEQAADPHAQYAQKADLAAVATSGNYNDLTNKPDLSVLEEVTVYADMASFPATGETNKVYIAQDTGYMYRWSGSGYVQLTDQTAIWGQISGNLANQTDLSNALAAKVDRVAGKGLSTNDYTDAEQSKLSGIEPGATQNATDAALRDRSTHTGTQPLSTISDAGTAASHDVATSGDAGASEVVKGNDSRLTDARAPTSHDHPWAEVTGKPATATRWPAFTEVADKPATYPASAHNHTLSEISDAGTAAAADTGDFDAAGTATAAVDSHETTYDHTTYDAAVLKQKREELLAEATLSLDFANNRYEYYDGPVNGMVEAPFNTVLNYTRGSAATARNATGGISDVGVDEQRLVGNREGLLIEEQRTRLNTIAATPVSAENIVVNNVAHTISFYGTGSVELSGVATDTLNGTADDERVTLTFTPTAGTLTLTPYGTVTDLQLEEGENASSVIRGDGSQVTRAADQVSRVLGQEFNALEGTWFVESSHYVDISSGSNVILFGLVSDGFSGADASFLLQSRSGQINVLTRNSNGTIIIESTGVALNVGQRYKFAIKNEGGSFFVFIDGSLVSEITNVGVGFEAFSHSKVSLTGDVIGVSNVFQDYYIPLALPAAELQTLTTPEDAQ